SDARAHRRSASGEGPRPDGTLPPRDRARPRTFPERPRVVERGARVLPRARVRSASGGGRRPDGTLPPRDRARPRTFPERPRVVERGPRVLPRELGEREPRRRRGPRGGA